MKDSQMADDGHFDLFLKTVQITYFDVCDDVTTISGKLINGCRIGEQDKTWATEMEISIINQKYHVTNSSPCVVPPHRFLIG